MDTGDLLWSPAWVGWNELAGNVETLRTPFSAAPGRPIPHSLRAFMDSVSDGQADVIRMLGRIEKTVDTLDNKLDLHSVTLAQHDVQIVRLIADLQRQQQRGWERFVLWAMIIVNFLGVLVATTLPLIIHR